MTKRVSESPSTAGGQKIRTARADETSVPAAVPCTDVHSTLSMPVRREAMYPAATQGTHPRRITIPPLINDPQGRWHRVEVFLPDNRAPKPAMENSSMALAGSPPTGSEPKIRIVQGPLPGMPATQWQEVQIDMDDPGWIDEFKGLDSPQTEQEALAEVYLQRFEMSRSGMSTRHAAFLEMIKSVANADGKPEQALPTDLRKVVLHACLAGESSRRSVQILKSLERVSRAWAVTVSEEIPKIARAGKFAELEDQILKGQRTGLWLFERMKAKAGSDRKQLSQRWQLPMQDMTEDALQILRDYHHRPSNPNEDYPLNLEGLTLWMPCAAELGRAARWSAFTKKHGQALRRLSLQSMALTKPVDEPILLGIQRAAAQTLKDCPNLRELKLEQLDPPVLSEQDLEEMELFQRSPILELDFSLLSELTALKTLSLWAPELKHVPNAVLSRLDRLILRTTRGDPASCAAVTTLSDLKTVSLESTEPGGQDPWLPILPKSLAHLKLDCLLHPGQANLPALLTTLEWKSPSNIASLRQLPQLSGLLLGELKQQEDVQAVTRWLNQANSAARPVRSLQIAAIPDADGLSELFGALQANKTLRRLALPFADWKAQDAGKLAAFMAGNLKLLRLELAFSLPARYQPGMETLLVAIAGNATLRKLKLSFRIAPYFAGQLQQDVTRVLLKQPNRGLDWRCTLNTSISFGANGYGYLGT
jgi:hypothetical protein